MPIRVNNRLIDDDVVQFELDRLINFYSRYMSPEEIKNQYEVLRLRAEENAIGTALLLEECEKLDFLVSEEEIEKRMQELKENIGEENFLKFLQERGIDEDAFKGIIEKDIKIDLMVRKITEDVAEPTEEEIKAHYEAHKEEYRVAPSALVQHILVSFDSNSEEGRSEANKRIEEIISRLNRGEDFSEVAAAYSDCPSGKKTGGSLGWISKGMTIPQIDNTIFSIKVKEISQPVETPLGLHILYKADEREGYIPELYEIEDKIRDFLRHVKKGEVLRYYIEELKKRAKIERI